jgi:hypothetical protein
VLRSSAWCIWLLQYFTVYMLLKAYLLDYSFWVAAGILTIVRLATVVPNAPGNIGLGNIAPVSWRCICSIWGRTMPRLFPSFSLAR